MGRAQVGRQPGQARRRFRVGEADLRGPDPRRTGRDDRRNHGERRFGAFGSAKGIVLFVVCRWRCRRRRLISARKAGKHEQKVYASRIAALPGAPEDREQDEG
ncbi:BrnT family toxin [Reyranella soli]|uniref:BrnT family toxin n=1 Tax=Reyranella soli TaxID=1230389 RepID=UPI001FE726E7|nr:BrnT family toxin [Reyranella soli]